MSIAGPTILISSRRTGCGGITKNEFLYGYIRAIYKFNDDLCFSLRSQVTTWNQTVTEKVPASTTLNQYCPSAGILRIVYGDYRSDPRYLMKTYDLLLTDNKPAGIDWNVSALSCGSWRAVKYNSTFDTTNGPFYSECICFKTEGYALYLSFTSNMRVYSRFYSVDPGFQKIRHYTHDRPCDLFLPCERNKTFFSLGICQHGPEPIISNSSGSLILSCVLPLPDVKAR